MKPLRLNRRALLSGAGGIAIALPWLEIMTVGRESRAASPPAQRLLTIYQPGGTVMEQWRPTGTETDFTLSPILQPFGAVKDHLLVLDGIDMKSARGEQNQAGMVALLTGTAQEQAGDFASGPSIDQVIAGQIAANRRFASLQMAVRWGTGKSHGLVHPINIVNYADNASFEPIAPRLDPVQIFNELFGALPMDESEATWDRSILDAVAGRYKRLAARVGAEDRARLEDHLARIRQIEREVGAISNCSAPELPDTTGYDPYAGLDSTDDGSFRSPETDAAIPLVGKLMMDMLVMAFACDMTGVGTMQWSDCEAKHTFPWLNLSETLAYYENDGGYHPDELTQIATWYSEQHSYLLQQMAGVDMGGHSLLDETVVFIGSHISHPATHAKTDMPFLLAGGGGGLRGGRYLTYDHPSHNDLLVSLLNLMGDPRKTFGDEQFSVGPLPNLV